MKRDLFIIESKQHDFAKLSRNRIYADGNLFVTSVLRFVPSLI